MRERAIESRSAKQIGERERERERERDTGMQTKTVQTVKEATVSPFFSLLLFYFVLVLVWCSIVVNKPTSTQSVYKDPNGTLDRGPATAHKVFVKSGRGREDPHIFLFENPTHCHYYTRIMPDKRSHYNLYRMEQCQRIESIFM